MKGSHPADAATATMLLAMIDEAVERKPRRRSERKRRRASPPLPATARLITRYGLRPGLGVGPQAFHAGLDFSALRGTPVFCVRAGTVARVALDEKDQEGFIGYGNAVVIHHEDEDVWTFYAHLEEHLVVPEMRVVAGQAIGRLGNSTNGRAPLMLPRLHFEVRVRGGGGYPPFPGPFRLNNRDPEVWLRSRGIVYDRRGRLVASEERRHRRSRTVDPWPSEEVIRDFERLTPRPKTYDEE